jgi:RNA-binding protein
MELTNKQRRWLKGQAHSLDPFIHVGKGGLSEGVLEQAEAALARHELVKARFSAEREERSAQAADLAARTGAELIATIGRVAILYRAGADPAKRRYRLPRA